MVLHCPRCKAHALTDIAHIELPLSMCGDCGGVWLSTDATRAVSATLDSYLQNVAAHTDREATMPFVDRGGTPVVGCPHCQKACERESVGGVEIDRCPEMCGAWFDRGEIQRIAAHLTALKGESVELVAAADKVAPDTVGAVDVHVEATPERGALAALLSSSGYAGLGGLFDPN